MAYIATKKIKISQQLFMQTAPPLIVTLTLDKVSHDFFTKLRNTHYPKHCNFLEAHLTLFHRLPADISLIDDVLKKAAARAIISMEVSGITNIVSGVFYNVESDDLLALHKKLQQAFKPWLITKDRKKLWPHITIQNKVTVYKAAKTTALLLPDFKPFTLQGTGFTVWQYCKGPWKPVQHFPFNSCNEEF